MKNENKPVYVAPSIEVIELESESSVMQASLTPIGPGNPMFGFTEPTSEGNNNFNA